MKKKVSLIILSIFFLFSLSMVWLSIIKLFLFKVIAFGIGLLPTNLLAIASIVCITSAACLAYLLIKISR
jgi:hypothetical protein